MFLGHTADDGKPWSARDRELAKALFIYERSLCDGCSQELAQSMDPDVEGWYLVETHICAGCQALEKAREDSREPGARFTVRLDPAYVRRT